jgi:hypothetical protein
VGAANGETVQPFSVNGMCSNGSGFLRGSFNHALPERGIVQFSDATAGWRQWLVLPGEGWPASSPIREIGTSFLGTVGAKSAPVKCVATEANEGPVFLLPSEVCPKGYTIIDSGPEATLRQFYVDSRRLRMVLTVAFHKFVGAGIILLDDHLWWSLDKKVIRHISVHSFEPQSFSISINLPSSHHHIVRFGTDGTTGGEICI